MPKPNTVYLNGQFIPKQQATVSVMDRGFLLADGVYDSIPAFNGKLFHANRHLQRLRHNLKETDIKLAMSDKAIVDIFETLISKNTPETQQNIYIQVTRGSSEQREQCYGDLSPTLFIMAQAVSKTHFNHPVKAILHPDIRWNRCDIKSINRLANVLMSQAAKKQHADEALIIDNNCVLEGASSNVFIYHEHSVITPPLSHDLLGGVTREIVKNLCETRYTVKEQDISVETLLQAEEAWITSSSRGVAPITAINENALGDGKPGKHTVKIQADYQAFIHQTKT